MASAKMNLAAYKKRNAEIQALLKSIPPANSVIILHEPFLKQSREFESTIAKLKSFLKMLVNLAKLNPLKYKEWWQNAYAKPLAKVEEAVMPQALLESDLIKSEVPREKTEPVKEPTVAPALPPRLYQH